MNEDSLKELMEDYEKYFGEVPPKNPFDALRRCLNRLMEDEYREDEA